MTQTMLFTKTWTSSFLDYVALLKPRVILMIIFMGACGLLMAPGQIHPLLGALALLSIGMGSGGAAVLNMWYDRDVDVRMKRTRTRPLPAGRIDPGKAFVFGILLSVGSVIVMGLFFPFLAAFLLAFSIFFYSVVYTIWLKRWTSQNIVIGGAAGAFPPLIGWSCVGGNLEVEGMVLFMIIFLWTPSHFWALALSCYEDYQAAGIPMLPVTSGMKATKIHILFYSLALVLWSLVPVWIGMATLFYGGVSLALGALYLFLNVRLWRETRESLKLFGYSLIYLFVLFLTLTLDRMIYGF